MKRALFVLSAGLLALLAACSSVTPPVVDDPNSPGGDSSLNFTMTLTPAALALAPGGTAQTTVVLDRTAAFTDPVSLTLGGDIVGAANDSSKVSGSFAPSPAAGGSSTLSLTVGADVAVGEYALNIAGSAGEVNKNAPLTLTVTDSQAVLLVDDDRSSNNYDPADATAEPSVSDTLFTGLLGASGISYNTYIVPADSNGPSFEQLQGYAAIIWYTASDYGGPGNVNTISSADEIALKAFLDQGERKALLFSNSYVYGVDANWTESSNTFLTDYIGAIGGTADAIKGEAFTASGVAGTVTAGGSYNVAADTPLSTYVDVINPATGTDTLVTVEADPDASGTARTVAAVSGRKGVGIAASSSVVYVGFPVENIVDVAANTKAALFQALLSY